MIDYILLSDYIRLCNFMDYNYRIAYSAETLSSRMNTYSDEYNIFQLIEAEWKDLRTFVACRMNLPAI